MPLKTFLFQQGPTADSNAALEAYNAAIAASKDAIGKDDKTKKAAYASVAAARTKWLEAEEAASNAFDLSLELVQQSPTADSNAALEAYNAAIAASKDAIGKDDKTKNAAYASVAAARKKWLEAVEAENNSFDLGPELVQQSPDCNAAVDAYIAAYDASKDAIDKDDESKKAAYAKLDKFVAKIQSHCK